MHWPAYVAYRFTLTRANVIELRILRRLKAAHAAFLFMLICRFAHFDWFSDGAFPAQAYLFMLTCQSEHFDWLSDGAFPAQAYACDDTMTDKFAAAFLESKTPGLEQTWYTCFFGAVM